MLAQILVAASLAAGSTAAKTITTPPGLHLASKDKTAFGRLERILGAIADRMREATSPQDVPWLISSKVFDEDFAELMEQSEALLESTNVDDLVEHAATGLPPELHEVGAFMGEALPIAAALRRSLPATASALPDADDSTEVDEQEPPSVEDVVSDPETPRAIRDAIYGGHASVVCTIALLDPRPMPPWLHDELLERARQGQRDSLRVLLAIARREGVEITPSPVLDALEPFDLEAAERDHEEQRAAFERGLAASRRAGNA